MKIFLVDGSSLLYRSHFALARQHLTSSHGEITSAAYGVATALVRLVEEHDGDSLLVSFDRRGPNFRHEIYPEYKAQRPPMPSELATQVPRVRQVVSSLGLPLLEAEGFEADDVLASLAREGAARGHEMWIYSGDKDFIPMVGPGIGILKPTGRTGAEEVYLDEKAIRDAYGVRPAQYLDVLNLMGDKVDNIPGVPGIGEKTAVKLVAQFESVPRLLEHLDDKRVTPRHRKLLEEHRDSLLLSRKLLTLEKDVPIELDWDALPSVPPYPKAFLDLCRELEFYSLIERVSEAEASAAPATTRRVRTLASVDELPELAEELARATRWAMVLLTSGGDPMRSEPVALGLARDEGEAVVVPVDVGDGADAGTGDLFASAPRRLPWGPVREVLGPALRDASIAKGSHDLKHDQIVLGRYGVELGGGVFDTRIASYLLAPERRQNGLDVLAAEVLGQTLTPAKSLRDGVDDKDLRNAPVERLAAYVAERADVTLRLWEVFEPQLEAEELTSLMFDVEMPLSQVLLRMERRGVRLDLPFLRELADEFRAKLEELTARIYASAGEEFNLNSPKQLQHVLFTKLGLKPVKKTSTGYSTDVDVLQRLSEVHELPADLLDYRQVQKLLSTYVEALPKLVHPETGCVHTSYNQAVAATGRLSSTDPNLQNIPIRTELGRRIRQAFLPRHEGWWLLAADYSQIELRLMAHFSGDDNLREAFVDGGDVHAHTASLVNDVPLAEVDADMRRRAKAINFGILYGMGARALAQQIDVKTKEAQKFIDQYFERFPRVRAFIDRSIEEATVAREVRTILGRRRRLPELASRDPRQRAFGERVAVNTQIQGSAADLIKMAMIRLDARLREEEREAGMLLQVHDELILEVREDHREPVGGLVREVMEGVFDLTVPLVVDVSFGRSWAQAHA